MKTWGRFAIGRIVTIVAIAGGVLFALQGGEFGTWDLLQQRARKQRLLAQIDTLRHQIDSLERVKKAVETDPATQERIAREQFGMVRGDKEILYRFAEPADTTGKPGYSGVKP
ncbi:MAG TPA: septum formation initiator family protein [Gemmatimonadaceae bacterium]|nr:septum formation initiator family protein [Gemmatimonadaceae bacterium]